MLISLVGQPESFAQETRAWSSCLQDVTLGLAEKLFTVQVCRSVQHALRTFAGLGRDERKRPSRLSLTLVLDRAARFRCGGGDSLCGIETWGREARLDNPSKYRCGDMITTGRAQKRVESGSWREMPRESRQNVA